MRKTIEDKIHNYQGQLKSLAAEVTLAEERERHRIAQALHDDIGQTLAACKIKLEAMKDNVSAAGLTVPLNEIHLLIEKTIQNTRTLTFELSPPILYELGLEPAVEWLAEQAQQQHRLNIKFDYDEQAKSLSEEQRVLLFSAVRELLINITKHAKAKNVHISLIREGNHLQISVEDDGVGSIFQKLIYI